MINAILQTNAMRRNSTFPAAVRKLPVDARQRKRDSELAFEQLFQKRDIISGRDRRVPAVRREGYRNFSRIRQESPEFSIPGIRVVPRMRSSLTAGSVQPEIFYFLKNLRAGYRAPVHVSPPKAACFHFRWFSTAFSA